MKNITIIYPDSSAHIVSAIAVQRYRLNENSFNILVYAENKETYITPIVEIGGTICKVPYHDIDLEEAELLGEISTDRLPNVILSAILLEPGQDMTEAYEEIQEIANQAEAIGQWFSKPEEVMSSKEPVYEHRLYTTYQYDQHREGKVGLPQVTYEHLFNVYRKNGNVEFEFKKPLLFSEVQDAITGIVQTEQKNSLLDEIKERVIEMPVAAGTTVADYITQPDGKVQIALALAIPGVHKYTVTFGKCPDRVVYEDACNSNYATVLEKEYNGAGNDYAFQGGFIGLLPIAIGEHLYESLYKIKEESKKGTRKK